MGKELITKEEILQVIKDSCPTDIDWEVRVVETAHSWIAISAKYISRNLNRTITNRMSIPNQLYKEDYSRAANIVYQTITKKLAQLMATKLKDNSNIKGWLRLPLPEFDGNNFEGWYRRYLPYLNGEIPNIQFHDYNGISLSDIEGEYLSETQGAK